MIILLVRAADIKLVGGRAFEFFAPVLDVHGITRLAIGREEFLRPFPRDVELAGLADDDSPAEQRQDQQGSHGDLAFSRGLVYGEIQRAGGEEGGYMHEKRGFSSAAGANRPTWPPNGASQGTE